MKPIRLAVILSLLMLDGCALGPDFRVPDPPATGAKYPGASPSTTLAAESPAAHAVQLDYGLPVTERWWTLFQSAALDNLVAEALRSSPNVEAAQASLQVAQEQYLAQRASLLPVVQLDLAASRQRNATGTLAPTLNSGVPVFSLFTGQLSVGYGVDLWGGNRRAIEGMQAQRDYQRYQLDATRLTLAGNVVAAAIQLLATREQIAAGERVVALQQDVVAVTKEQQRLGGASAQDVLAQELALTQARMFLPPLRKQESALVAALSVLRGNLPEQSLASAPDHLALPESLPVSIPSDLVRHRPDVRMAEAQLHVASAAVGVAEAARLPQLNLTATLGGTSTILSQTLTAQNRFWSAGSDLSQVLFDSGARLHNEKATRAALDQAGAAYRTAVLAAFQDVANALHALQFDTLAYGESLEAEHAAKLAWDAVDRTGTLGGVSFLAVAAAEQAYQQAVIGRIQSRQSCLLDVAALMQALGGGLGDTR